MGEEPDADPRRRRHRAERGAAVVGIEDLRPRLATVHRPPIGAPLAHTSAMAEAGALDDQGDDLLLRGELGGDRRAGDDDHE